jgi:hypothetical protein
MRIFHAGVDGNIIEWIQEMSSVVTLIVFDL